MDKEGLIYFLFLCGVVLLLTFVSSMQGCEIDKCKEEIRLLKGDGRETVQNVFKYRHGEVTSFGMSRYNKKTNQMMLLYDIDHFVSPLSAEIVYYYAHPADVDGMVKTTYDGEEWWMREGDQEKFPEAVQLISEDRMRCIFVNMQPKLVLHGE